MENSKNLWELLLRRQKLMK